MNDEKEISKTNKDSASTIAVKRSISDDKNVKRPCGELTRTILLGQNYHSNNSSVASPSSSRETDIANEPVKDHAENAEFKDYYFKGYANINIHRDMIADHVRTMTYRRAILKNYELFRGKVVADIGAGTGILSVFCVHAGAKKVYAIEASRVAEQIKLVAAENNMQDRITVIHQKVEDTVLPEPVDIIVSEWMGYCLLYESMLSTVLLARDKWLKPGGEMFPNSASIYLVPYTDSEVYDTEIAFWDSVYDMYKVNMSSLKRYAGTCLTQCPHVKTVDIEDIMGEQQEVCKLNLLTATEEDIKHISSSFSTSSYGHSRLHGFCCWFTVTFPGQIVLTTSPYEPATHWAQTIFYLDRNEDMLQDSIVKGEIKFKPSKINPRFLEVDLSYSVDKSCTHSQHYIMDDMPS